MTGDVVDRVRRSARYRDVDQAMLERLATEELPRSRTVDDAVKRVKRRLHQSVGAFRGSLPADRLALSWAGDFGDPAFRAGCGDVMRGHASTRERLPHLDGFFEAIWQRAAGPPRRLLDLGCGLTPLSLPWMRLDRDASYHAVDVDDRSLAAVRGFLSLVEQPHQVTRTDLVSTVPSASTDVALLLKLVTTLDRQDPDAATRLLRGLDARHAVVSFTTRTLAGRGRGMERSYRARMDRLASESMRVREVVEASVPNELVFVLSLESARA